MNWIDWITTAVGAAWLIGLVWVITWLNLPEYEDGVLGFVCNWWSRRFGMWFEVVAASVRTNRYLLGARSMIKRLLFIHGYHPRRFFKQLQGFCWYYTPVAIAIGVIIGLVVVAILAG